MKDIAPRKFKVVATTLIILHAVGFAGTAFFDESIMRLTPINLLLSMGLVFWMHEPKDIKLLIFFVVVFLSGFLIEWAGVATGKIFGQYSYGNNLGVKMANVPLIIGLNWVMLSYCSMNILGVALREKQIPNIEMTLPFLAALLMVLADFWIEQLCSRLDFWRWQGDIIPLQNYTAWFSFSFAFNFLYMKLNLSTQNRAAALLYLLQVLFFILLYLFL